MGTWTNKDGLKIFYGVDEGTAGAAGFYEDAIGNTQVVEVRIPAMTALTDSTQNILDDFVVIPKNARIEWVDVQATTAVTSGGAAVLDIGLQRLDRSTELDYDGLLADAPITDYNSVGETKRYQFGVSGAGALVGTVLANPGYLVATYDTAAYTAGAITIRIGFSFA